MAADPLLVFSPHLDDAVLSIGNELATRPGSVVVTVLAGMPVDETVATAWDASCGFASAGDSLRARWEEDAAALAVLSASAIHLGFLDGQYGPADGGAISAEIERIIGDHPAHRVYAPFGLVHTDHILVSNCFVDAIATIDRAECRLYADIPYYAKQGSLERRRTELEQRGLVIGPLVEQTDEHPLKRQARDCYVSQLRPLGDMPIDLPELTAVVTCTSRR